MLNESASIFQRSLARAAGSWLGKSDVLGALKVESNQGLQRVFLLFSMFK